MPWSGEAWLLAAIRVSLLVRVLLLEAGVATLGLSLFLGHGLYKGPAQRRTAALRARGATALQSVLDGQVPAEPTAGEGRPDLPRRIWLDVLTAVAPRLVGTQRARLTSLADDLGVLANAEACCKSRLWWRRIHGVRLFTLLGGGEATVPDLLADSRPEVRSQAAQWAVEHHDAQTVGVLLAMLDHDEDSTRFALKDSLIRIGRPLRQQLADHLLGRRGAVVAPALEVASALADPIFLPSALALCHDEVPRIRALAAGLAGGIGGAAALDMLAELLRDEAPEVRGAAARALGRAGHWPAAASIASLLSDSAWDVRQPAAVALRRLGSPGVVLLRRALTASDPLAADIARWAMDMPESVRQTL